MKARQAGFSYIEVLVATVLVVVTLVPAMDALRPGLEGSALHKQRTEEHYAIFGKMEEVLVEPFTSLDSAAFAAGAASTPTAYSDVSSGGLTRNVFIWRYDIDDADGDADVFTGGEDDLLWVSVSLSGSDRSLETLLSRY